MKCKYDDFDVTAYIDGVMSGPDEQQFVEHVRSCESCAIKLSTFSCVKSYYTQAVQMNDAIEDNVMSRIDKTRYCKNSTITRLAQLFYINKPVWKALLSAATAVAIVCGFMCSSNSNIVNIRNKVGAGIEQLFETKKKKLIETNVINSNMYTNKEEIDKHIRFKPVVLDYIPAGFEDRGHECLIEELHSDGTTRQIYEKSYDKVAEAGYLQIQQIEEGVDVFQTRMAQYADKVVTDGESEIIINKIQLSAGTEALKMIQSKNSFTHISFSKGSMTYYIEGQNCDIKTVLEIANFIELCDN